MSRRLSKIFRDRLLPGLLLTAALGLAGCAASPAHAPEGSVPASPSVTAQAPSVSLAPSASLTPAAQADGSAPAAPSSPAEPSPAEEAALHQAARKALRQQIGFDLNDTLFLDRVGGYYACIMLMPGEEDIVQILARSLPPDGMLYGFEISYSRIDMGNVWQVWYLVRASLREGTGTEPGTEVRRFYTREEYLKAAEE